MSALSVSLPTVQQPLQRNSSDRADIDITGLVTYASNGHIEAMFDGPGYTTIASFLAGTNVPFTGTLPTQTTPQAPLHVRIVEDPVTGTTVADVGVGDVFGGGGQSNMDGFGTNGQIYWNAHGLKASLFKTGAWGDLIETAGSGSFRPLLATMIMARTGRPVGFVFASAGGTGIQNWQPTDPGNLYDALLKGPILASGPSVRDILWHLGESDAAAGTAGPTFETKLKVVIDALFADCRARTMVCELQHCTDGTVTGPHLSAIQLAQVDTWSTNAHTIAGPDFSAIDTNDGFHFISDAKLLLAATGWFNALVLAGELPVTTGGHISNGFASGVR